MRLPPPATGWQRRRSGHKRWQKCIAYTDPEPYTALHELVMLLTKLRA